MLRPIVTCLLASILLFSVALADRAPTSRETPTAHAAESDKAQWVAVHRRTGLWAKPHKNDKHDELFRMVGPGATFRLAQPPNGPRVYVWDPTTKNYAWIDADDIGPIDSRRVRVGVDQAKEKEKVVEHVNEEAAEKKSKKVCCFIIIIICWAN